MIRSASGGTPSAAHDFAATLRLFVEKCDRFAQTGRRHDRGQMMTRRRVPFARSNKDAATFA